MGAANLENADDLISDGHDPNDGDEEPHRAAQDTQSWVCPLRREYENKDGRRDTSDGGGNQQPSHMIRSI